MNVVSFNHPRAEEWLEAATFLRELADRFERGEISECVCVVNDRADNTFQSFGHFEDRWRLLGALEYAKTSVHGN